MRAFSLVSPIRSGQFANHIVPTELPKPTVTSPNGVCVHSLGSSFEIDDANFANRETFMNKFRVIEEIITARFEFDHEPSMRHPFVPGANLAGIVDSVGPEVKDLKPGDRVIGFTWPGKGAWGEYCVTEENFCHKVPKDMSLVEAAATSTVAMPVSEFLKAAGPLKQQQALVLGACGTVGRLLTEVLADQGANVTAVCQTDAIEELTQAGARAFIHDHQEDITAQVEPHAFDVVFDCVGGETALDVGRAVLKSKGKFLTKVGPMDFHQNESLSWLGFMGKLNEIGTHTIEGFFEGPEYRYVAAMNPDWAAMDKYIFQPGHKVHVDQVIPFEQLDYARSQLKHAETDWETGKIVFLHKASEAFDPYAPFSNVLN